MSSSQSLHVSRVQAAIVSQSSATSALIASWRRSSGAHHLDPAGQRPPVRLTEAELRDARQAIEPLLRIAQTTLDRLFQAVGGAGCCVLLADRNGVPIDRRGYGADDKTFESWGLWQGSVWSEQSEGTNGIGTCIVEQRPLTIHRDDHFFARNTLLSCTTAPIFDHEGKLVAALDVSSCRADLIEGFVGLVSMAVSDAARRIEADHFRMSFPGARIMLAPVPGSQSGVLLAVDADDILVGAGRSARQMLGITEAAIKRGTGRQVHPVACAGRRCLGCRRAGRVAAGAGRGRWQCLGRGKNARHQPFHAASQAEESGARGGGLIIDRAMCRRSATLLRCVIDPAG